MPDRRHATSATYEAEINAHLEMIAMLSIDPAYGCLTKTGLLLALAALPITDQIIVYFDVDKFKAINDRLGKATCNDLMTECIKPRAYDVLGHMTPLLGRWYSGDELAGVFSAHDALGYIQRTQRNFHRYGCSATFVMLPALWKGSAIATIDHAEKAVSAIKQLGRNNLICEIK